MSFGAMCDWAAGSCPYCIDGGELSFEDLAYNTPNFISSRIIERWVECTTCGISGPRKPTLEEAIKAWREMPCYKGILRMKQKLRAALELVSETRVDERWAEKYGKGQDK